MKKSLLCLGILVCFLLFLFSASCAEIHDFTFRNGIHFGDSIEDVKVKEPNANQSDSDPSQLICDTTLSGINNSRIFYLFSNNGLIHIALAYPSDYYDTTYSDYVTINDGLIRKYGKPVNDIDNATICPGGQRQAFYRLSDNEYLEKKIVGCDQWEIALEQDKKLVIEHIMYSFIDKDNVYFGFDRDQEHYLHRVSYLYFDDSITPSEIVDQDL